MEKGIQNTNTKIHLGRVSQCEVNRQLTTLMGC